MTPGVLIWGDTGRTPALRHELPLAVLDPFLYLEAGERRAVVTNTLEDQRIAAAAPDVERIMVDELGIYDLIASGMPRDEAERECWARAVTRFGLRAAVVPAEFPLALADRLRADGVELTTDDEEFAGRRRAKSEAELAGVRRATAAGMDGMRAGAALLRDSEIDGERLVRDGEVLTAELVRARIREVCARAGCPAPGDIIVGPMGPGDPVGHEPGSGPLPPHTPIGIDLWPQDEASSCWTDMTRTFVRGEVSDAVAELHRIVQESHERACALVRPGVTGRALYDAACDVIEGAGYPTQRTKEPGTPLRHGFPFSLGHGVGLEVHEAPGLGLAGASELVPGDVIAVEPGVIDPERGGMRVEDLLLVTEDGSENLTAALSYDLTP
ncbi:MAG: M24 family metallopeptidase [Solirubrobacteraceae bacterium]